MPSARPHLWIGVTTLHGHPAWFEQNTHNYIKTLTAHGATAVLLSPDTPVTLPNGVTVEPDAHGRLPDTVLDALDGLILSGGGDVDPKYFGANLAGAEPESISHPRDELELGLAVAALQRDLPIFGICRGCQVLNVAAGGGMVQHLDGHRSPKDSTAFHDVTVTAGSRFGALVATERFAVNTFHHQGMDRTTLAPIFVPAAIALPDDWLVEAYESPHHRWVIGVQWHPERLFELDAPHRRLWQSFLAACRPGDATP